MKRIYIIIILLCAAKYSIGQDGVKFGVMFDPTIMWFQSDSRTVVPQNSSMGFNLGMSLDYFFANNYAFATGISLFNTGCTLKYLNGITIRTKEEKVTIAAEEDVKYRIQYINLPAGLKFKTHRIGRYEYSANMGFNVMVRATAKGTFDVEDLKYEKVSVKEEVNFFNMGWHFGGKASYSLGGAAAIFAGVSYMHTFLDMTSAAGGKITSNNISIRLGVLF